MRLFTEFLSTSSTSKQAGKSPSQRMTLNDINYQVKRSNSTKNWRRIFGYDPDSSDLMGEFIASKMGEHLAKAIYGETTETGELSPRVELVLDVKNKELKLASKYLNAGEKRFSGGTLDEIWRGKVDDDRKDIKGHGIISAGTHLEKDDPRKILKLDEVFTTVIDREQVNVKLSKKELYHSMKLSMLLGDHDVNPGNLYVTYDKQANQARICRIDYGHAFSDLIKKWGRGPGRDHSPKLGDGRGLVLDALNREKINGGQSKIARDYRGIIPDHDLAGILREEVNLDIIQGALSSCKKELNEFFNDSSKGISGLKSKVFRCFSTLSSRMGFKKLETKENRIDQVLKNADQYTRDNAKEMQSVANLIDIQAYIQDVAEGRVAPKVASEHIAKLFQEDERYLKGKSAHDSVEWVKMDGEKKPTKCSLIDYIALRAKSCTPEEKQRLDALAERVQQSHQVTTQVESHESAQRQSQGIQGSLVRTGAKKSWVETVTGRSPKDQSKVVEWR